MNRQWRYSPRSFFAPPPSPSARFLRFFLLLLAGMAGSLLRSGIIDYDTDETLAATQINIATLKVRAVTLAEVFALVERQTPFAFVYVATQLPVDTKLALETSDVITLSRLLNTLTALTDLVFQRRGQKIVVRLRQKDEQVVATSGGGERPTSNAELPTPNERKKTHYLRRPSASDSFSFSFSFSRRFRPVTLCHRLPDERERERERERGAPHRFITPGFVCFVGKKISDRRELRGERPTSNAELPAPDGQGPTLGRHRPAANGRQPASNGQAWAKSNGEEPSRRVPKREPIEAGCRLCVSRFNLNGPLKLRHGGLV